MMVEEENKKVSTDGDRRVQSEMRLLSNYTVIVRRHRRLTKYAVFPFSETLQLMHCQFNKIILQGSVDGKRRRGRPRKSWKDNIKEWPGQSMSSLLRVAENRRRWAAVTAEVSVGGYSNDAWASRVLIDWLNYSRSDMRRRISHCLANWWAF